MIRIPDFSDPVNQGKFLDEIFANLELTNEEIAQNR